MTTELRPTFSEYWHRVADLRPRLRIGVRADRRRLRGETWHVLEDPLSGGVGGRGGSSSGYFRLNESAWRFVALLDGRRTVAQAWKLACDALGDDAPTQPEAVTLLGQLGSSNLLQGDLPEDARALFRRYRKRVSREFKSVLAGVLSIKLPLVDPDRALGLLDRAVGWIFSMPAFAAWALLLAVAAFHLAGRWGDLVRGSGGVLSPANLPWLTAVFVVTKLIHELGHGVACKRFGRLQGSGGEVHSMGVMLLVLMPVPFVDATSAWALRSTRRRIAVGAAGMYVELAIAAVAAIIWSRSAEGSLVHAVAYNAVFIAGVSTVLFNANPLLKYDGYYMLSDLVETPNLASRAREQVFHLIRRHIWKVRGTVSPAASAAEAWLLAVYHVASTCYRVFVFIGIALFVMSQWFIVGIACAAVLLVGGLFVPLGKFAAYLAGDPRLERSRGRAVWTTIAATGLAVAAIGWVPAPDRVRLHGVVEPARTTEIYAAQSGVVTALPEHGARLVRGAVLVRQSNDELVSDLVIARARLAGAEARRASALVDDPARAGIESERVALLRAHGEDLDRQARELTAAAPDAGVWVCPDRERLVGVYVRRGEHLGSLVNDSSLSARLVADQTQAARLAALGDAIASARSELRAPGSSDTTRRVRLSLPAPSGSSSLFHPALSDLAGGPLRTVADGPDAGQRAAEPYFEIRAESVGDGFAWNSLRPVQRVVVRVDLPAASLWSQFVRSVRQTFQERFSLTL